MRRLTRSVTVKAPASFARAFMNTYFLDRGAQPSSADLALRFPLPAFIVEGLTVEKRVRVKVAYAAYAGDGRPMMLSWEPLGNRALPSFSGTLMATPQTEMTCSLEIAGSYAPPGGIAGIAFDQIVGVRIARATVDALLEEFEHKIAADYALRLVP